MKYAEIIRVPDSVKVQLDNEWIKLEKNGSGDWCGKEVYVMTEEFDGELKIKLSSKDHGVKRIYVRWNEKIEGSVKILGDHWERGYGDLEWRGIVPERVLPWFFLINDGSCTHGYGVKTGANAMCFWQVDKSGISLCLDVRCGNTGVMLGSKVLEAAAIVSRKGQESESPYISAREFCRVMCEKPVLPAKPVYGGNNWYYAYGESSNDEILNDSRLIASLSSSKDNPPFMVIDDGWQVTNCGGSCNGGPWNLGNFAFPDMHKLAFDMKETGVRPGLWFRPLLTAEKVKPSWRRYVSGAGVLDPSVPDVLEKIHEDVSRFVEWGFELIKHDFSTWDIFGRWGFQMGSSLTDLNHPFYDRSKTTAEIILGLYRTIADGAKDSLIIGCNTVSHLSAGIFAIQRTGDDTSGMEWERTRKMGVNTLAFRMSQHNTFYSSDADCVGLTKNIPWKLNRQWLRLLSESGTPLFVSAAPSAVGEEQRKALKEAFEKASKPMACGEPLDWLDTACPAEWKLDGNTVKFDWFDEEGVI